MEKIVKADKNVLNILGNAKMSEGGYRQMKYCVCASVEEGRLLLNLLTRELLLLTEEEYAQRLSLDYLHKRWFVVPQELNEKEYVDLVRWAYNSAKKKFQGIIGYTVLTTTECNARCFYCYEKEYKKYPMTQETAIKTAEYIRDNCGGKPVRINWFGGEPLYNDAVIDTICKKLMQEGVKYRSGMISNAYLFDEEMVKKARRLWNLKNVQVTIDGTEDIYNRSKAFIYEGNAYRVVLENIKCLLDKGIVVTIRMNMNLENAEDLLKLTKELEANFRGEKNLKAYARLIFDEKKLWLERYTEEELEKLYATWASVEEKLYLLGFSINAGKGISRKPKLTHCMVDSGEALVIAPDGSIGLCEHFAESNFIGHIDSPELDSSAIQRFCEMREEFPECADCFYYPECLRLKICTYYAECLELERNRLRCITEELMHNELRSWKERKNRDK